MVSETIPKKILDLLTAGISMTATDLDIRDLSKSQDSVDSFEHNSNTISWGAVIVEDAATLIVPSGIDQSAIIIYNNSSVTIFLGGSAVTTANGLPLVPGASYSNTKWTGTMYGIVATGTANARYQRFFDA